MAVSEKANEIIRIADMEADSLFKPLPLVWCYMSIVLV
jgi:hypothetical protein